MPRLLRTVARTAAIAGTASAVSGRVQHRQAQRFAARDAQNAPEPEQDLPPEPSAPGTSDVLAQLKTLGELKAQGVLTEAEFSAEKAKILGR
jgi:Short C-terminal domain